MTAKPEIQTNAAGIIRVRFRPPAGAPAATHVEHARQLALAAVQGPVEFLYRAEGDGGSTDMLFAGGPTVGAP